jgi:predicted lipid-binding transport protein (Tim44 family)
MRAPRRPAGARATRDRGRFAFGVSASVWLGVLLALSANEACAAALGSFATSVGLLAALAALFVLKGWPAHLPASALSTAGGALLVAGGAAWWWRARATERLAGFVPVPGRPGGDVRPRAGGLGRSAPVALPMGFDREALRADLRRLFVQLQDAWDRREMRALGLLTTPEMLAELCLEFPGRTVCSEEARSTEVVTLHAELLGFEALAQAFVVSVEFSGLIRESADGGAVPFRELWMLTRSKGGAVGWRLARHQALL